LGVKKGTLIVRVDQAGKIFGQVNKMLFPSYGIFSAIFNNGFEALKFVFSNIAEI
jgi:hypothetical protein